MSLCETDTILKRLNVFYYYQKNIFKHKYRNLLWRCVIIYAGSENEYILLQIVPRCNRIYSFLCGRMIGFYKEIIKNMITSVYS